MKLIIAEKPSVAKAIYTVLGATEKKTGYMEGSGYYVSWCYGHLAGLYSPNDYGGSWANAWSFSQLPMIPETWKLKTFEKTQEQFSILKKLMEKSDVDEVICATDADREGECIFRYVYELADCHKPVKRLWVSSLEESAIRDGMAHLKDGSAYDNLYDAGLSRAEADWLVGMNGSRLFTCRYGSKLTIGRVQTPTLAMLVERDNAVANFQKQKYFTVELDTGSFRASSKRLDSEADADQIATVCQGKAAEVTNVEKQVKTQNPPKLFDLTSLQREANKLFGYTAQQTLDYQQSLYEKKLSTYPRTDSQYITADMLESAESLAKHLLSEFSNFDFVKAAENLQFLQCINDKKVVSHPAILPTENVTAEALEQLPEGEKNILFLEMVRLFCAASDAHKYESVKITLMCEENEFTATGKTILAEGWKKMDALFTSAKAKSKEKEPEEKALPDVQKGQVYGNVTAQKAEHYTSPPKPYTESALLSAMEHAGQENYDENSEKKA